MTPTMEEVAGWLREVAEGNFLFTTKGAVLCKKMWLKRAAQVEAMGWRPISEAPTDGAWILAVNAKTNPGRLHVVQYSERHGRLFPWVTDSSFPMSFVDGLTHFMFLPQPPVTK